MQSQDPNGPYGAKEAGEDTEIGAALQRILTEIDEIAEATLRWNVKIFLS